MSAPGMFFNYAGISSAQFGLKVKYGGPHNSIAPPTVERMVQIPTRPGAWNFGSTLGPRVIKIDCHIYSGTEIGGTTYTFSPSDLMVLAHNIETWLDPRLGDRPLILPDDSSIWYAHYSGTSDFSFLLGLLEFSLPFIAPDPFPH